MTGKVQGYRFSPDWKLILSEVCSPTPKFLSELITQICHQWLQRRIKSVLLVADDTEDLTRYM